MKHMTTSTNHYQSRDVCDVHTEFIRASLTRLEEGIADIREHMWQTNGLVWRLRGEVAVWGLVGGAIVGGLFTLL